MKIQPIIWKYHKTKDKTFPIKIRVTSTSNGKTKVEYFSVGASVKEEHWDVKERRVKLGKIPNAREVNIKIMDMCNLLEKNFLTGGVAELGSKEDFYWWFQERIDYSKEKHSLYNYKRLCSVQKKLKEFAPVLPVKKIDNKFIQDFEVHLTKQGLNVNYITDILMRIKFIFKIIINSGQIEHHKNPFLNYKFTTKRTEKKRNSIEDIQKLEAYDFSKFPTPQMAVDMFLFSFYCAGIRFGDLCRIKFSMIQDGRLKYTMHKSNNERNIKLMPQALKIIDRYRKKNKEFLFDTKVDWTKEDYSISVRNSFFRKNLHWACKRAEVSEVGYHSARNSFADYAHKMGIDIYSIKELLGHSKISTTEIYMKAFHEEETDIAMNKLFGQKKSK
ncbi:MAG: tyrosine-type recombinase/integrase [Bacteroidota bacterium]